MSTDIYGCIEIRHPCADEEWYDGEPWQYAMGLYPLYSGNEYTALGCLFGVRNYAGWDPVAAARGLPADVSPQMRRDYEHGAALDVLHSPTWVSWHELQAVDMSEVPRASRGGFDRVSRREAIGPGSGWEHVFAVMQALAGRFGPRGVRLVVYFD